MSEVAQLLQQIERVSTSLIEALDDADTASHRLHGAWDGEAALAHADGHQRWSASSAQMTAALTEIRDVIASAHRNYAAAIQANTSMWGTE